MERSDQRYTVFCDAVPIFHGNFYDCWMLCDTLREIDGMERYDFRLRKGEFDA